MRRAPAAVAVAAAVSGCTAPAPAPTAVDRCSSEAWSDVSPLATADGPLRSLSVLVENEHLYVRVVGSGDVTVLVDRDLDRLSGAWSYGSALSGAAWDVRAAPGLPPERHVGTPLDWSWERDEVEGFREHRDDGQTVVCWPHDGGAVRVAAFTGDADAWLPNPFDPGVRAPDTRPPARTAPARVPGSLAFAYQFAPDRVRGCTDLPCATEVYAALDHLVLAAGLEEPEHASHGVARSLADALRGRTEVWGYVSHVRFLGRDQSEADVVRRIEQWRDVGVSGVFLDESQLTRRGWDDRRLVPGGAPEELTRARQARITAAAHDAGLAVFANAHSPYDVLAPADGVPSPLGPGDARRPADMYLLENPSVVAGRPVTGIDLQAVTAKYGAAVRLAAETGVRLAAVDTTAGAAAAADPASPLYALGWWRAAQAGVAAYALANPTYSAPDLDDLAVAGPPPGAVDALAGLRFADDLVDGSPDGRRSSRVLVDADGRPAGRLVVDVGADGVPVRYGVVSD